MKLGNIINALRQLCRYYVKPQEINYWGYKDTTALVRTPISCTNPKKVFFEEGCRLSPNALILNNNGKFVLKSRAEVSFGLTVVTGDHTPTMGIPITVTNPLHINDKENDIIIEEDAWLGVNVTLLSGAKIGRGSIVGACSLIKKEVPPYAVVVGVPARIIAVKFSKEQILEHERIIYPAEKRLSEEYLNNLFESHYNGLRTIGTDFLSDVDRVKIEEWVYKLK